MKVICVCEKCGAEFEAPYVGSEPLGHYDLRITFADKIPHRESDVCPYCSQLTYGPLTEEMMAEALWEAAGEDFTWTKGMREHLKAETRSRARFVLRLLQATRWPNVASSPELWADDCSTDWRDWLLDLAREDAK